MMKAYKMIFYLTMVVALVLGSMGCSSSDDDIVFNDNDTNVGHNSENEGRDLISFSFQTCNNLGYPTQTFRYGENIVFSLLITNNSDIDISYGLQDADIIFGTDMFSVYTEEGSFIGLPWTGMYCEYVSLKVPFLIPAKSTKQVFCKWKFDEGVNSSHPLCKASDSDNENLPVGKYISSFCIEYNTALGSLQKTMEKKFFNALFVIQ